MEKLITFVVPCYNSEAYMEKCVDSLLKAGECAEILIINDGSTDRTGEIGKKYENDYPGICRLLSQENGGHGEGINHGLREAVGKYFKVVDSDDWADEYALDAVVKKLTELESSGGVDLLVANYVYVHMDGSRDDVIKYKNVFPENRVFGWSETGTFLPWQYLTLHSCIFRTQILRDIGLELPKHTFYEDNLFAYLPLPYVKKMYYMNVNFYQYLIGRQDQSVAEESLKKKCSHQILVSKKIFKAYDLDEIMEREPKLGKYMYHEVVFMMTIATAFTRLNKTEKAEQMIKDMWNELKEYNPKLEAKIRKKSLATTMNLPGIVGRNIGLAGYRISRKFVTFN